jgi:hypothetical protein
LVKLTVSVNNAAATAGTVVRFGIYSIASNGAPGPLIADLGTVDVTSTGLKTIDFSANPIAISQEGMFFANCWQGENSTFNFQAYNGGGGGGAVGGPYQPSAPSLTRAISNASFSFFQASVTGVLPTNPPTGQGNGNNIPLFAFEIGSVA